MEVAEKHRMGLDGLMQDGVKADLMTPMDEAWYDNARSELSNLRVPGLFAATNPHERLFFANFDGTGNDLYGDPEHPTNVGALHIQIEAVSGRNPRISSVYLPGPGTQKNPIARVWDGATGNTYDALLEEMYAELVAKAREWKKEDPQADIRIITTGFSRGAEQAAGFSRMVHERGIQDIEGLKAKPARTAGSKDIAWILPPLVPPGRTPISEVLFDPVGTGRPRDHDRTLPSSVVSGLQIVARDERRNSFPSTQIIPQGHSSDGRFLGVTVPGSHSDIGGSYHLDGLSILNFNLAADFINAHSDVPLVVKQGEPGDMSSAAPRTLSRIARVARAVIASAVMANVGGSALADDNKPRNAEIVNGVLRIPFSSHDFSARCYDTLRCQVRYGKDYFKSYDTPSPPLTDAIKKNLDGTWGVIANFPPPAEVRWVAKDGTSHEARIDIGEIFKDQYVRYGPQLDVNEVRLDRVYDGPGIVLVVNSRNISVYMREHISLLRPLDPENPYSNFRSDLVLAFTQAY